MSKQEGRAISARRFGNSFVIRAFVLRHSFHLPSVPASRIIRPDVGNLIRSSEHPFSSEAISMKRGFSSSRFDWLTTADCILRRNYFRRDEAEFPTASSRDGGTCNLLGETFRGSRAMDRASLDALRPLNNWANIKDQHELLSTGETPAPWARSVSTKGRPRAFPRAARAGSQTKNILATHRRIFWERRGHQQTSAAIAQRSAAATATPARAATAA